SADRADLHLNVSPLHRGLILFAYIVPGLPPPQHAQRRCMLRTPVPPWATFVPSLTGLLMQIFDPALETVARGAKVDGTWRWRFAKAVNERDNIEAYGRIDSRSSRFASSRRFGKGISAGFLCGSNVGRPYVLYRDLRLPDERARFGKSSRRAAATRVSPGRLARRGATGFLQHVQHSGKGRAKGFFAPGFVRPQK